MLQRLTRQTVTDYFLKESQNKRERYKNVMQTNKAHTNTTGYRSYLLLNLSSIGMLRFLQIFFSITWVIDLYTMLQRLIEVKKYDKAITVGLPSQMLKECNTSVMFVLFPLRDTRF